MFGFEVSQLQASYRAIENIQQFRNGEKSQVVSFATLDRMN